MPITGLVGEQIKDMMARLNDGSLKGFGAFQAKTEHRDESQKGADKWELVHWPYKCRCNFIRLVLEECNVDYLDSYGKDLCSPQIQSPASGSQKEDKQRYFEAMGPPFLRKLNDRNKFISQSMIMTQFVANEYGLRPKDDIKHAQCGMIVANCVDLFEDIKAVGLKCRYNPSETDAKKELFQFVTERFDRWLKIIEKPLKRVYDGNNDEFYVFDDRITQSDLAIFNILDGIQEWLGPELLKIIVFNKYKLLEIHFNNMLKKSNGVKKLLKRQKENNVLWWPYVGMDFMGIILTRNWLKEQYLSKL